MQASPVDVQAFQQGASQSRADSQGDGGIAHGLGCYLALPAFHCARRAVGGVTASRLEPNVIGPDHLIRQDKRAVMPARDRSGPQSILGLLAGDVVDDARTLLQVEHQAIG
ncbi:hypothetical protein D3C87_1288200 [compost metagenome]